jgi:sigma-B regulation protein RsbU (phosphoserine phosphatase)
LPGVPLGSFPGITYDELTLDLHPNDLFVFCTDGIFEAMNAKGAEFGSKRLCDVIAGAREQSARDIVDAIFDEVSSFRGAEPQADDMTAVAIKITPRADA